MEMGLRYRREVRLAPGIRLNLSKSGHGITTEEGPPPPEVGMGVELSLRSDGVLGLYDAYGTPLPPGRVRAVRAEHDDALRGWLAELCEGWNRRNDQVLTLHHLTPPPDAGLTFEPRPFDEPPPEPYIPPETTLLDRSWPPHRRRLEEEVAAGKQAYEEELWRWRRRKSAHDAEEAQRRKDLDIGRHGDRIVMESFLAEHLSELEWPAETTLAFEISLDKSVVFFDLALPELDLIPARRAHLAARGLRIRYTDLSEAQIRRSYAAQVHAAIFRLIGEVFVALPVVERVIASGYIERPDETAPGVSTRSESAFLLSTAVGREGWRRIDFDRLQGLEPSAVFESFELRRRMTKHGVFTPVEPLGALPPGGLFEMVPAMTSRYSEG